MNKPQTLNFNGYEIAFKLSNYQNNDRLALVIYEYTSYGCAYQYGVATVNIDDMIFGVNQTYIDENNNNGMAKLLVDNGLATYVGYTGFSGYCQYPLVELNMSKLEEYLIIDDNQNEDNSSDDDDIEWDDASDDEDVDALFRELLGDEEDAF